MNTKQTAAIAILVVIMLGIGGFVVISSGNDNQTDSPDSPGGGSTDDHYPVTVQTLDDNKQMMDMIFTEKPKRVVVLWSSTVEMLVHFGLEDSIVGAFADPDDVLGDPAHQAGYDKVNFLGETPDMEKARALNPDLIIGWSSSFAAPGEWSIGTHEYWNGLGVKTYVFNSPQKTMDDYYKHIDDIGKIFDAEDRTDAYMDKMTGDADAIQVKTDGLSDDQRKSFLLIMYGQNGVINVYGDQTIGGSLGEIAGGKNLLEDGVKKLSNEEIRQMNPDFIFIQIGDFDKFESHQAAIDSFKAQPGMTGLTSQFMVFEFNQVYPACVIDPDIFEDMYNTMYP